MRTWVTEPWAKPPVMPLNTQFQAPETAVYAGLATDSWYGVLMAAPPVADSVCRACIASDPLHGAHRVHPPLWAQWCASFTSLRQSGMRRLQSIRPQSMLLAGSMTCLHETCCAAWEACTARRGHGHSPASC